MKAVPAIIATLFFSATIANAASYFYDDFNDADMSDWTDLELTVRPFQFPGSSGYESRGEDPLETKEARALKPLSDTNLSDTVHLSFDLRHTGGLYNQGGMGFKWARVFLVDDSGWGYGLEVGLSKSDDIGVVGIVTTADYGTTTGGPGVDGGEVTLLLGNDFYQHHVELVWDRINASMDVYADDMLINIVSLDTDQNNWLKDPTMVVSNPRNTYGGWPGYLSTDNIWIGDEANSFPMDTQAPVVADADGPYTIDEGDTLWLSASYSFGAGNPITSCMWDLDNDGTFETDAGPDVSFGVDYAYLMGLGLGPSVNPYVIGLYVEDSMGLSNTAASTLTIVPEPATLSLLALGGLTLLRRRSR